MYWQPDSLLNFKKNAKNSKRLLLTTVKQALSVSLYEGIIFLSYFKEKRKNNINAKKTGKVSRSMINKWADKGKFTVIKVGSRVRICRDEFEDWMEQRDLERSMQ